MIAFKAIKPATKFKSSAFRTEMTDAANVMLPLVAADFNKAVATWKEKPKFIKRVVVGNQAGGALAKKVTGNAGGVMLEVLTLSDIFRFLDEGTKIRYATMTKNFQAKTRPRHIGSVRGRGGLLFISRQRPRPGIKAREFTSTIHAKWQPRFFKAMQAALQRGAVKSGHAL